LFLFRLVPGLIGTLQAMETIKLLLAETSKSGGMSSDCRVASTGPSFSRRLFVFDGESGMFRTVSLRPKQSDCAVCASPESRTISRVDDVDYALFCGRGPHDKVYILEKNIITTRFLYFFCLFSGFIFFSRQHFLNFLT
jgi:hypothetical protein